MCPYHSSEIPSPLLRVKVKFTLLHTGIEVLRLIYKLYPLLLAGDLNAKIIDLSRSDKMKIRYFVLQIILQNPSIFLNISVLVPNAPVLKI